MLAVTEILAGKDVKQRKFEQQKYKWWLAWNVD